MKYFLKLNTSIVDCHSLKNDLATTRRSLSIPLEIKLHKRLVDQLDISFNDFSGVDRQLRFKEIHSFIIVGLVDMSSHI